MTKPRYARLDHIRAIAFLSMFLYHAAWDLVFLYGWQLPGFKTLPGFVWQQSICWTFILLSGFCHSMSRHPVKNAVRVFLAGALVTLVTCLFTPNIRVVFGVLTLLGSAGLLTAVLDRFLQRLPPLSGLFGSAALFFLLRNVNRGSLGFGPLHILDLPGELYANSFTAFLGFPTRSFYSSDYFSLLPWFFLYLCGYFLHKWMKQGRMECLQGRDIPLFRFLSRRCLLLYLLHQPLLSACFMLIF